MKQWTKINIWRRVAVCGARTGTQTRCHETSGSEAKTTWVETATADSDYTL